MSTSDPIHVALTGAALSVLAAVAITALPTSTLLPDHRTYPIPEAWRARLRFWDVQLKILAFAGALLCAVGTIFLAVDSETSRLSLRPLLPLALPVGAYLLAGAAARAVVPHLWREPRDGQVAPRLNAVEVRNLQTGLVNTLSCATPLSLLVITDKPWWWAAIFASTLGSVAISHIAFRRLDRRAVRLEAVRAGRPCLEYGFTAAQMTLQLEAPVTFLGYVSGTTVYVLDAVMAQVAADLDELRRRADPDSVWWPALQRRFFRRGRRDGKLIYQPDANRAEVGRLMNIAPAGGRPCWLWQLGPWLTENLVVQLLA